MKLNKEDLGIVGIVVEDWDITKSFNPKTITTDYNTWITYISRKPVPENTPITDTEYWKPICKLQNSLALDYNNFKDNLSKELNDLKILVNNFLNSIGQGTALDVNFGNNNDRGITQKSITDAIKGIWKKLDENYDEVTITINPENYYIGPNGCDVIYNVQPVNDVLFDYIEVLNENNIENQANNTNLFEGSFHIDDTSNIIFNFSILGELHTKTYNIKRFTGFWIGSGDTYNDVMNDSNLKDIDLTLKGSYNVTIAQNKYLIILIHESLQNAFVRADLNGIEIDFDQTIRRNISGQNYIEFKSKKTFQAGTYNIDINS